MLEVKNLSLSYAERKVIKNLSFVLDKNEVIGLYGKNGSGKSSLCLAIGNLNNQAVIEGEILIDGKSIFDMTIAEKCSAVGMIFQEPDTQLFSPTVEDELAFAPENLCIERNEIEQRIDQALKLCGIEKLKYRNTNSLSGGEKQLVAIASVLTMSPKILIADEITAKVDNKNRLIIKDILRKFANNGASVLFVSHNKEDLLIADRRIELEG